MTDSRSKPVRLITVDSEDASRFGVEATAEEIQQIFKAAEPALIASLTERGFLKVEFSYSTEDRVEMYKVKMAEREALRAYLTAIGVVLLAAICGLYRLWLLS